MVEQMTTGQQLRQRLRKITALFEEAATAGERQAAAIERIRQALNAGVKAEPIPETKFPWRINGKGVSSTRFAPNMGSIPIATRDSVTPP
jgi:hypothetical protein